MTRAFVLGVLATLAAGCGTTTAGTDATTGVDTGTGAVDASANDAPTSDAGASDAAATDATANDAARPDAGPCVDDDGEEDDTLAAGMAASAVYAIDGTAELTARVACPGDDDFVHGYADCCDTPVGAELTWPAADGRLELSVLAPDGTAWPIDDTSDGAGTARRVETSSAVAHDFIVRIHNPGATRIVYDATLFARVLP